MPDPTYRAIPLFTTNVCLSFLVGVLSRTGLNATAGWKAECQGLRNRPSSGDASKKGLGGFILLPEEGSRSLEDPLPGAYLSHPPPDTWVEGRVGGEHTASCGSLEGSSISIHYQNNSTNHATWLHLPSSDAQRRILEPRAHGEKRS